MGVTKDFIKATIADALTPTFQRPMEDLIYETLDRRQVPTRSDFTELRDLTNNLRGQVSGAIQSLKSLSQQYEELSEHQEENDVLSKEHILAILNEKLAPLDAKLAQLETSISSLKISSLLSRIHTLEEQAHQQKEILSRIHALEQRQAELSEDIDSSSEEASHQETCIVSKCDQPAQSRNLCSSHYGKFRRGTLPYFINKGGQFKIGSQKYTISQKFEAKPFAFSDKTLIVEGEEFSLSDLQKSK